MRMRKSGFTSFLTLLLCLSLIVGATYALLTSESKNDIAVTSGNVDVTATLEKADGEWVYSPTLIDYTTNKVTDDANAADQATGTFVNGGFATLSGEKLTLTNMTPGDKVMLNIRISNNSNIAVKYSTRLWVSADTGLFEGLEVSVGDEPFTFTQQSTWKTMKVGSEDIVIPVVIKLPEETGNDYQDTKTEISFTVSAVQANADTDSLENNEENTLYLYNATDLFMFAKSINENGVSYAGQTVVLVNTIDLNNMPWTPIGKTGTGGSSFVGTFDGNGKSIKNLYVDRTSINDDSDAAGLFGWIENNNAYNGDCVIKDLTIEGAKVYGNKYAGAVAGYITATAKLENCTVTHTDINGYRVGGVVGFVNSSNIVDNCKINNSVVTGSASVGAIAGYNEALVTNSTVDTETVTVKLVANSDKTLNKLLSALKQDEEIQTIYLSAGEFTIPNLLVSGGGGDINVNLIGATNADGTPATIMNFADTSSNVTWSVSGAIENIIFKDATNSKMIEVTDGNATSKDFTMNNCVFDGASMRFNATATITNCVFDGNGKAWSGLQYSFPQGDIVIDGCTFSGYCFTNININADSNYATFEGTITVKNCKISALVDGWEELGYTYSNEGVTLYVKNVVLENNIIDCDVYTPKDIVTLKLSNNKTSDGGEVSYKNW